MKTYDINLIDQLYLENVVDIRTKEEYEIFSIDGVTHIEQEFFVSNPDMFVDKDQEYYLFCQDGKISYEVIKKLNNQGYDLVHFVGGIVTYTPYQLKVIGRRIK